ncbi:phosphate ABC transporter substrate-binding protein [Phosphitispora sp. TUW77]|uniref:phosphate ABC transporter substrate-binding protein n=1 Tax=Phosphitispora sp. TUW77 TaxID=3152361 RepID=UPI003AB2508D
MMNLRKRFGLLVGLIMIISIMLTGCSASDTQEKVSSKGTVSEETCGQILFAGSTTLVPAVTQITKNFIEKNQTWDKVAPDFPKEKIEVFVSGGGSGAGVKAIIDDSSTFGMVSRNVKDEEKQEIDGYQEYKLGIDALTISVNPENKIHEIKDTITTEELRKIFSGECRYWDEVDSRLPHDEIVVLTRDIGGGAHEVFQNTIMGETQVSKNIIQAPSMGALVAKIMENKNAVGYASVGAVNQNEGKIVPLNVDGVAPTAENILSGEYKISRPLLIIARSGLNKYEQALVDYIISDEGLKVISELGFVPAR